LLLEHFLGFSKKSRDNVNDAIGPMTGIERKQFENIHEVESTGFDNGL
jgi:hypothetical protein